MYTYDHASAAITVPANGSLFRSFLDCEQITQFTLCGGVESIRWLAIRNVRQQIYLYVWVFPICICGPYCQISRHANCHRQKAVDRFPSSFCSCIAHSHHRSTWLYPTVYGLVGYICVFLFMQKCTMRSAHTFTFHPFSSWRCWFLIKILWLPLLFGIFCIYLYLVYTQRENCVTQRTVLITWLLFHSLGNNRPNNGRTTHIRTQCPEYNKSGV